MKKIILATICLPMLALAHGSPIDAVDAASHEALTLFKGETEQVKSNFRGIKAWPAGADVLVKVYVNQDNKEVSLNYTCVMNHAGGNDAIVCSKK
ncbi:MAG: hypothetical protein A4S09_04680 [Proteobacteria bacterium SG_bin7]|nr:MAG: hypothetical protein A4S09_04680 [Proteobacteria bacterium SG_bin7]